MSMSFVVQLYQFFCILTSRTTYAIIKKVNFLKRGYTIMINKKYITKIISLLIVLGLLSMNIMLKPTYASSIKTTNDIPTVQYRVHVQGDGWLKSSADGQIAGTTGKSKRMEAIQIKVIGNDNLGIKYKTHLQTYGWGKWSENGKTSGTVGQSKRLEAISISLTGKDANKYNIFYSLHVQKYGWLTWACNGELTGSTGVGLRAEAIKIVILKKGQKAPKNIAINPLFISEESEYYTAWAECE